MHCVGRTTVLIGLLAGVPAAAGEMDDGYRQLAASLPIIQTSSIDKGHPWRLMFGYSLVRWDRLTLHQDWVISYLDAGPRADSPGGHGAAFGTDMSFQWRHHRGIALTPHYEIGGGIQYAAGTAFPAHGGRWMSTLNAGVGLLIPWNDRELNVAVRWQHISNAGVFPKNAGYDAVHLVLGIRWGR
jgi:hypothetical protein